MRYSLKSEYVEQHKIIIENEKNEGCLCRVEINHRLYKIVYLEPLSIIEIFYNQEEIIDYLSVSVLREF